MLKTTAKLSMLGRIISLAIIVAGATVVAGWAYDQPSLKEFVPSSNVTMKFSTAISFICTGIILLFMFEMLALRNVSLAQIVMSGAILTILLFMVTHIASAVLSSPSGLDNLLVNDTGKGALDSIPGRPSDGTIAGFLLIAAAGLLIMYQSTDLHQLDKFLAAAGIAIATIGSSGLVGHAIKIPMLYFAAEGISNAMSVNTAALFVATGLTITIPLLIRSISKPGDEIQLGRNRDYKGISLRSKLISLTLICTVIPIVFIGTVSVNNSSILSKVMLTNSIVILGAAAAISVTLVAVIISGSLSKRIVLLTKAVNMIASGTHNAKLPKESFGDSYEISQLTLDIEKLKDSVVNVKQLETLVEKRTEDLSEANRQLEEANNRLVHANQQLQINDNLQKEFVNIAAHELRTPMMPIMAISERIQADLEAVGKKDNQLVYIDATRARILTRNVQRLDQLAQDILDVTRIESNSLKLSRNSKTSLQAVILPIIRDIESQTTQKGLELHYSNKLQDDLILQVDVGRITQVLMNLLNNAIRSTPSGGKITISVEPRIWEKKNSNYVIISIKDTGIGIDPEIMPKLFSKFATKSEGGIGLGLYISKSIVEAHGGKIWAENNKDGCGATFTFSLPCPDDKQIPQQACSALQSNPA